MFINWSGHGNLGDDAMDSILRKELGHINGWHFFGGGTLISPGSEFYALLDEPEKTIGISLGVSRHWDGQGIDRLRRMRKIYTRDYFSYLKLKQHGVENTLSVDLLCYMQPKNSKLVRRGKMKNFLITDTDNREFMNETSRFLHDGIEAESFKMSKDNDIEGEIYTDMQSLIDKMSSTEEVFLSRLHANIAAWIAKVPKIHPFIYDDKIYHFFERVMPLTQEEARAIIKGHLEEIKQLCQHPF